MENLAKIHNQKGEVVGEHSLAMGVFGVKMNEQLVHQSMVTLMSNARQVLAHTKGRSEVRGGGKKPWKQKGTGRARVGSSRSPIWSGGGVTFGPTKDRNFSKQINKKMKQKAMFCVLSDKVKNGKFVILDKLDVKEFKTKSFNDIVDSLEALNVKKDDEKGRITTLIINGEKNEKAKKSASNLVNVELINLENINIVDLLKYKNLVMTKAAVDEIEKRHAVKKENK